MEFEWDEAKRQLVLAKHGLDFRRVLEVFKNNYIALQANSETEHRQIAVGFVNNVMIAVIYTERSGKLRLITARRARENESRAYYARYS